MRKRVVGVMGPGDGADEDAEKEAFALGRLIAANGWVLLTGGRDAGVMAAATQGAHAAGGLTLGILPSASGGVAAGLDIVVYTGMGSARNYVNVLSSDVVVACGMGAGTASEVALALKAGKPVLLLRCGAAAERFFTEIGGQNIAVVESAAAAVERVKTQFAAEAG